MCLPKDNEEEGHLCSGSASGVRLEIGCGLRSHAMTIAGINVFLVTTLRSMEKDAPGPTLRRGPCMFNEEGLPMTPSPIRATLENPSLASLGAAGSLATPKQALVPSRSSSGRQCKPKPSDAICCDSKSLCVRSSSGSHATTSASEWRRQDVPGVDWDTGVFTPFSCIATTAFWSPDAGSALRSAKIQSRPPRHCATSSSACSSLVAPPLRRISSSRVIGIAATPTVTPDAVACL